MSKLTVTTPDCSAYEVGDILIMTDLDRRWWKRLWHFILFRDPPKITKNLGKITSVKENSVELDYYE